MNRLPPYGKRVREVVNNPAGALRMRNHTAFTPIAPGEFLVDLPKPDTISYRRLADIQSVPIRWLWPGRIARGKVTMIAGDPGLGKSQITASIASIVSTGGQWPVDRTKTEKGNVIILSAEDGPADTIEPASREDMAA